MEKDDKILTALLKDRARQCEMRSIPTRSDFLDMHERSVAESTVRGISGARAAFFGGYAGAEREICVFLPDYMEASDLNLETPSYEPIRVLHVSAHTAGVLTHRDYLGALLGLGIRRELIGDILVREDGADILFLGEMEAFLLENYTKAGRVGLNAELRPIAQLSLPEKKSEMIRDTVASLRLDSVLASAFRLSRGTAQEAIARGLVSLNSLECLKPDAEVGAGDRIALRGKGKAVLTEVGGQSKKGRTGIVIERLL